VCPACLKLASPDTTCAGCPCLLVSCNCALCCLPLACSSSAPSVLLCNEQQYYYETIFPRIPKKVEDDIQAGLRSRGLPTKGRGNGGCGGADRRGGDDGNRRPASVKASLSVAFGQRAPNRAGTKDTARFKAAEAAVGAGGGGGRGGSSRSRSRSREAPRRGGGATPERQPQRERRQYDYESRDRQREGDSR
jgi:pre-mRNA-splicing factor 38B